MTTLNKVAAEVITKANDEGRTTNDALPNDQRPTTADDFPVHALTDVTGFGLIGHAS
jgi:selenophosphate synthase